MRASSIGAFKELCSEVEGRGVRIGIQSSWKDRPLAGSLGKLLANEERTSEKGTPIRESGRCQRRSLHVRGFEGTVGLIAASGCCR